jgi:uncharacterized membrane protein YgdD (TMEM256/DUF423 family)
VERLFLVLAGINGFLAVMLGAFGAHGLRGSLANASDGARRLEVWQTAAHYHLMHALALGLIAVIAARAPESQLLPIAGYLFQAGIVLFSGSLYIVAFSGVRTYGAITPFGGLCFLAGWLSVVIAALKQT